MQLHSSGFVVEEGCASIAHIVRWRNRHALTVVGFLLFIFVINLLIDLMSHYYYYYTRMELHW